MVIVALRLSSSAWATHSLPTEYCCPVSAPNWPRRGRLRRFAPAAMQASRCSSVSERLYLLEAALKRARQRRCLNVLGSLGFTQRRRNCLLPCNTNHTQSPHRPLLRAGSRHAPEDARNGQSRHPGRRGTSRRHRAVLPLESLGVDAFTIRDLTLDSAQLFTGFSAHGYMVPECAEDRTALKVAHADGKVVKKAQPAPARSPAQPLESVSEQAC